MSSTTSDLYFRLLDTESDVLLFEEAFRWRDTAPKWFQKCMDVWKESFDEYMENRKDELHYGMFEGDEVFAVLRLIQSQPGWFNLHLSARRGADWEKILQVTATLRDWIFDQKILGCYGYIPTINRGICQLYESLGFVDTGIKVFKGVVHGKLVCWKHYAIEAPRL